MRPARGRGLDGAILGHLVYKLECPYVSKAAVSVIESYWGTRRPRKKMPEHASGISQSKLERTMHVIAQPGHSPVKYYCDQVARRRTMSELSPHPHCPW